MALLWAVVHSIYEESIGDEYPVVTHTFMGRTRKEAVGYFRAHLKTDSFLRGCTERGRFGSDIKCRTEMTVARYDTVTRQLRET
jgi:hypothetical protein